METLFLYFGKVAAISTVMFCYYLLFLKDKNFHQYNRFYLLGTVLVSLFLPFLKIDYFTIELRENPYFLFSNLQLLKTKTTDHGIAATTIFALAFGLVSLILLARFLFGIAQIFKFKRRFPHQNQSGIRLYITDLADAPFSFFRNLFWKKDILPNSDLGRQILKHEMIHIEQKHSYDQVFMQIISAIFWFNPAFYFIKKEISLIHEYLADKKSLKNSDTKAFAQMLLATHFSGKVIPGTSPLISSNLKKRLKMLQNPKTKFSYARRVFALPLLFTIVFAFIVKAKNKEIEKENSASERLVSKIKADTTGIGTNTLQTRASTISENPQITQKYSELNQIATTAGTASPEYAQKIREIEILKKNQDTVSIVNDDFEYKKIGNVEVFKAKTEKGKAYENSPALQKIIDDAKKPAEDGREKVLAEARKRAEDAAAYTSSPEFKKMMENAQKQSADAQKYLNSAEYKNAMEQARKAAAYTSSPEFKKMMENARKQSADAQKYLSSDEYKNAMAEAKKAAEFTNSKEFKAMMENAKKAADEGRKAAAKAQAYTNSDEFKKIIADAKAAAANGARAAAEATAFANGSKAQVLVIDGKNVYGINGRTITTTGIDDDDFDNVTINGKRATVAELHRLDRSKIKSTNINVNDDNGKKQKSIAVRTR